jgi:hypothetical protein
MKNVTLAVDQLAKRHGRWQRPPNFPQIGETLQRNSRRRSCVRAKAQVAGYGLDRGTPSIFVNRSWLQRSVRRWRWCGFGTNPRKRESRESKQHGGEFVHVAGEKPWRETVLTRWQHTLRIDNFATRGAGIVVTKPCVDATGVKNMRAVQLTKSAIGRIREANATLLHFVDRKRVKFVIRPAMVCLKNEVD